MGCFSADFRASKTIFCVNFGRFKLDFPPPPSLFLGFSTPGTLGLLMGLEQILAVPVQILGVSVQFLGVLVQILGISVQILDSQDHF